MKEMKIIVVTDDHGKIVEAEWMKKAEGVHRQLRSQLPEDYAMRLGEVFSTGGRMALVADDERVVSVAIFRVVENTYEGRRFYVDDLVTDASRRSSGAGRTLLAWLEEKAKGLGCDVLALDSGVQRHEAHRFYFRERMVISSFCFKKPLK